MILICYDGSEDSRTAVAQAARLFPGQPATVITVWETFAEVMARTGAGASPMLVAPPQIDEASEAAALEGAEEGSEAARKGGLDAQPRVAARHGTIAATLLEEARACDAAAMVLGSRGLSGIKSFMLGSVSNAVVQRADRPVVVVPSAEVAEQRREAARR